jgi:hypothetical protein
MEIIIYIALSFGLGFTLGGFAMLRPVRKLQAEVEEDMVWLKDQLEWLGEQLSWIRDQRNKLFELTSAIDELSIDEK